LCLSLGPPGDRFDGFARAILDELELSPDMIPTANRIVETEGGREGKRRARCQRAELTEVLRPTFEPRRGRHHVTQLVLLFGSVGMVWFAPASCCASKSICMHIQWTAHRGARSAICEQRSISLWRKLDMSHGARGRMSGWVVLAWTGRG
jgi:hypothetical protein